MTMTVQDIRNEFLSFFKEKGHEVVRSSSLVPDNDPNHLGRARLQSSETEGGR